MASIWKRLLTTVVVYSLAVFFGSWVFFMMIFKVLRHGRKYFEVKPRPSPPQCLLDPQYGTHHFIQLKQVKIHYVEAGDKTKPLMLFVHGFPEFWYSWRHQMKEFKKTHWVVAIDLRGYGESDKPPARSAYKIATLVADLKEIVEGLGRNSCVLVAHDWGGALAWRFTIQHPEMVDKLVMMNCPHPAAFQTHIRSSIKQVLMSWYIFAVQVPFIPEIFLRSQDVHIIEKLIRAQIKDPNLFTDEDEEAFKYAFAKPGAFTPPLNYYRNIFFGNKESLLTFSNEDIKKIKVPVLIIWGKNDIALNWQMASMSSEYVENCVVKVIPSASHWVQQDSVQLVNEYMSDFVYDFSKPRRLVRRMKSMRRQLVSSVSDVMLWTGMVGKQTARCVQVGNGVVTTMGRHVILSTFDVLHRMSGAPFTGLQNIALVI